MKNKRDLYLRLITNLKEHAKKAVSNSPGQGLVDFSISRLVDLNHVYFKQCQLTHWPNIGLVSAKC